MAVLVGPNGMKVPAVTVIILASDDRVGPTIESALAQDYGNFNCIVVEDELVVDCARVVAPYRAEQPDRLSFLPRKNGSDCDSLDDAWRQATDCYVTIVRSGEKFRSNWLSVCVEFLEANPEMIVGFPDWVLTDGQGNVLQEIRAPDYDLYKMVHDAHCMPGPGALIRRSAVSMPNLRNRSFRLADGYEIWLLLGLQGDFIHIPVVTAARQDNTSGLQARLAEYCRARDVLFKEARLPKTVHCWRHTARVVVAAKGPWTLVLASLRAISRRLLLGIAEGARKLRDFGIPAAICAWIGAAERIVST